jgi:hypothetical protein
LGEELGYFLMKLPKYEHSFKGAVALANWLKRENWFQPVPEIAAATFLPGFKNKVEDYHKPKRVVMYSPSDYLQNVSICIERAEGYEILLPQSFTFCEKKFAVCKELCHILTDDEDYKSHEPVEQIQHALQTDRKVLSSATDRELSLLFTDSKLSSEDFCFLLAMELLLPVEKRDNFITDVKVNGTKTPYDIALELKIPKSLVSFFIDSDYNAVFKRLGGAALYPKGPLIDI